MANQENKEQDLAQAWQKLAREKFHSTIKSDTIMTAITQESKSTISELRKRLKYKIYWSVFFILAFTTALVFSLNTPDLVLLLGIIVISYALGFVAMILKYRQTREIEIEETGLLQSVKQNAKLIKTVLKFEKVWGTIVFTPMILIGIFGGFVLKGRSLAEVVNDPTILAIGIVSVIVITPLLIWSSHKMNNYAFGALLKNLDTYIVKMETLK